MQLWNNAHDPQIRETQIPTYAIGMFDNIALRLGKFFQNKMRNPKYKLELTIDSSGKLFNKLQLGVLDAAFCVIDRMVVIPNQIVLLQTYSEKLIPVSSKLFDQKIETIPFILYNHGSHTRIQIDDVFKKHTIQPTIYAESTSVTFMRELALLGSGVALLPKNFVKNDLQTEILKRQKMPIQWERKYGLFVQSHLDPRNQFIKNLQEALQAATD